MTINDILYALITVMIPLVLKYVFQLISVKVSDSKYASAVNSVFEAVGYVNQTFVDSLKQSGNFDDEAKKLALGKAKEAAISIMSVSTRKWLEKSIENLDSWLDVQIENAVKASK